MSITLNDIFVWVSHYRYIVLFPAAIVEGPIVAVISGFLSSIGQLNFAIAYVLLILADTVSDSGLYFMGKYGNGKIPVKILEFFGIDKLRMESMEKLIKKHPKRMILTGKVLHGIGAVILFTAGYVNYSFRDYIFINIIITFFKSLLMMLIGYYFGRAYSSINHYIDYWALISIIIFIILYIVFLKYTGKIADKLEA